MGLAATLRRGILGLDLSQAEHTSRGFQGGSPGVRRRLDRVGKCVVHGYNLGLEIADPERLAFLLDLIEPEMRGFAYEGGAMGLATVDLWSPRGGRFDRYVQGVAAPHTYMSYIGAGGAAAVFSRSHKELMAKLDPFLAWLVLDGLGFFHAFLKTDRTVRRRRLPASIEGHAVGPYHAGVGRSLWFVEGGDPRQLHDTIHTFPDAVHGELWAGVGLACAYAGGTDAATLSTLRRLAEPFEAQLARGAVLAAHTRHVAGNPAPQVALATDVLCSCTAAEAHRLAVETMADLKDHASVGGQPTWHTWLSRLDHHLHAQAATLSREATS